MLYNIIHQETIFDGAINLFYWSLQEREENQRHVQFIKPSPLVSCLTLGLGLLHHSGLMHSEPHAGFYATISATLAFRLIGRENAVSNK